MKNKDFLSYGRRSVDSCPNLKGGGGHKERGERTGVDTPYRQTQSGAKM